MERAEELKHKEHIDEEYARYIKQKQDAAEKKISDNLHYKELQLEQIVRHKLVKFLETKE